MRPCERVRLNIDRCFQYGLKKMENLIVNAEVVVPVSSGSIVRRIGSD